MSRLSLEFSSAFLWVHCGSTLGPIRVAAGSFPLFWVFVGIAKLFNLLGL